MPRFAKLGVAASVQFSHAPSDRDLADRFWGEPDGGRLRLPLAPRRRARIVANGSDAPIEELDPLAGIAAGVLRTIDDRPAVASGAGASRWKRPSTRRASPRPGSKEPSAGAAASLPGQLADLVVLDRDPFECPPEELRDVGVVATMVGGRWVHNPPPWD